MKRNDRESLICITSKPNQNYFVNDLQSKENFFSEQVLLKENWGCGGLNKK